MMVSLRRNLMTVRLIFLVGTNDPKIRVEMEAELSLRIIEPAP